MAGVSEWSWPIPFVVPPCTRSAILRNRHKVPRCSGIAWPRLEPASPDRCCSESHARFSSPIALGGYRPWGCQVAGKRPPIGAKRQAMPAQTRPPKGSAAVCFGYSIRPRPTAIRRWRCFRRRGRNDRRRCRAGERSPRPLRARSRPLRRLPGPARSNMVSSRMLSRIERRPRAPVLRSIALRATAPSASSANVSSIFSISNSR